MQPKPINSQSTLSVELHILITPTTSLRCKILSATNHYPQSELSQDKHFLADKKQNFNQQGLKTKLVSFYHETTKNKIELSHDRGEW